MATRKRQLLYTTNGYYKYLGPRALKAITNVLSHNKIIKVDYDTKYTWKDVMPYVLAGKLGKEYSFVIWHEPKNTRRHRSLSDTFGKQELLPEERDAEGDFYDEPEYVEYDDPVEEI